MQEKYDAIYPGQCWLDTDGKRIQAHGASIFYEDGVFYWYGENKEYTDGKSGIWTWGIRCYSSKDLYNWTNEGFLVEPDPRDKKAFNHPSRKMDRPHIIKNKKDGTYILWLKYCDNNSFAILKATKFKGPYELVKAEYKPYEMDCGDFDLAVDENDGTAWIYMECDHKMLVSARLFEDYCSVEGAYRVQYAGLNPPFTREGTTHFVRGGKHYLLTSGMTGYVPNPSQVAQADDFNGPFTILGDPHVDDESCASFNSQISSVLHYPDSDLYIAIADRWVPDFKVTKDIYERLARTIGSNYDKSLKSSLKDLMWLRKTPVVGNNATMKADYVWLPITFEDGKPVIRWHDSWKIEDYLK